MDAESACFQAFFTGGIGAFGVVFAAVFDNLFLLFAALFVYGAGTATNLQARYAGTDLASDKQRATAVSLAMVSTTFGAVAGPNLVDVMGQFALSIGVPALAGPFLLAGTAFLSAGLVLFLALRPDPFLVAKAIAHHQQQTRQTPPNSNATTGLPKGVLVGALIMVLTQLVMVAVMTMTPIHMAHHGHSLQAIGLVIGVHVGAMYLPSLFTGMLVDRYGRVPMAVGAGITLLLAGLIGAIGSGESMPLLLIALALLGLGWNLGLISGTTLLVDHTDASNRAKMQGAVDVYIALAGASGGAMSGMIVAGTSYTALSLLGGFVSLLVLPLLYWYRKPSARSS